MNSLSTTDDSLVVGKLPAGISVNSMEVDFPDAVSHRSAKIFGNEKNNLPVRVRFKIIRTDENNNVTDEWKDKVYLYDTSSKKALSGSVGIHDGTSNELFCSLSKNDYTLGFYDNGGGETPVSADGTAEKVFYVSSLSVMHSAKEFKLGAFLSPEHSATPIGDGSDASSQEKATVALTVMEPIDYTNASAWGGATKGGETDISFHGNLVLEARGEKSVDENKVSGKYTTWQLRHFMLKDNSPIRLTVTSAGGAEDGKLAPSQGAVASSEQTINPETRFNAWVVPVQGKALTITPRETAQNHTFVEVKIPITLLSFSHGLNYNTQDISVMQASVTVKDNDFSVQTSNDLTGIVNIRDNVGH
ncbi:hypothetical protein [Cedecea sp. NFIX57]|uniref:hypothetical protein n=1 Tax=Cedecea sp. NFIX57 TaxID=1566286 RepID=UPI000A0B37E2|nr:hypothetical protein [Cedecea sp. NFIX57]SMG61973.1 hypothetical protein SAMN03159353_10871 [Cedecea sp. NFIX57]